MHRSLRAVSVIMGYSVACFSQNCSGLLKLSRWHLQTLMHVVSSPDRCGFNMNSSFFSRKRLSISKVFGSDISLRRDSALYNWVYWQCLSIVPALSHTIKSLYSSHAANGKLASFSAASCWCGVIWIWRYQRHSTPCDDTDSASDGRLLAFYDQFIKDYRSSQVPAHWCFYERTGEREVGYKRLMIVCRRSLLRNSTTKGPFIATQLNSARRRVELCRYKRALTTRQ